VVNDREGSPLQRLERSSAGGSSTLWEDAGGRSEAEVLVFEHPNWSFTDAAWRTVLPLKFMMNGEFRRYTSRGVLIEQGRHDRSLRVGTWRRWYDSGELSEQTQYAVGAPHGHSQAWHLSGRPSHDGAYEHGTRHGPWTHWYENGQVHERGVLEHAARVGTWRRWHANGRLGERRDHDGGGFSTWYEDGQRRATGRTSVMSDIIDRTSMSVGKLCAETHVGGWAGQPGQAGWPGQALPRCSGRPHGRWRLWWADGTLAAQGRYHLGSATGTWRYWDQDGARLQDPCASPALVEMFATEQVDLGCSDP